MSDTIAEVLAKCLERMEAGASLESCLADFPQQAAELEPLLRVTQQISPLSQVGPRPLFAQSARLNLENQLVTPHEPVTFNRPKRHTRQKLKLLLKRSLNMSWLKFAIAAALALTVTTGGVAYAAHSSNPGDVLYGLDLAMENVQLYLAPDIASKVQLHLEFARERLTEAQETFSENDVADGLEAMNEYGAEISAAAQLIGSADGADQDALLALFETAQGVHQDVLTQLLETGSDQVKDGIQKALDASDPSVNHPESPHDDADVHQDDATVPDDAGAHEEVGIHEGAGSPDDAGADAHGIDISACTSSLSHENSQVLVELAKQYEVDYQYVLQNFCVLGSLDMVREFLAGLGHTPEGVPADPHSNPPTDLHDNVPSQP